MPGLADILKKNKPLVRGPGGQLSEESGEEIQQLSGQAGLAAPPTTAIGQGMIGANPDQMKMAGTAAQKTAALSLASQQPQGASLQDALRRQQVRSTATAEESQKQEKSEDMKNLGSLGDRVTDFINVQREKLAQSAGKGVDVQMAGDLTQVGGGNINVADVKSMLQQYRNDPNNQNLLLQLNQSLGYDLNRQLSPQEVDKLYESAVQSISRGGAGNVDDDLNVEDLVNNPAFGYDAKTLSELLNVPEDQISKYSVGQLKDQLNKVQADEFNKTNQLEQQATSANLGQAERGLAHQAAMEASRTGQRSSEADVQHLEDQISNADQVTFAGKTMNVDDLLKDDTISGIIADYMNSGPDSETRKQIDAKEPGLRDFIQKNQAVLADASQKMQAGAQTFQQTQEYNKKLQYEPFGGTKLDDSIARLVIPGFGSMQANRVDPQSVPLLRLASEKGSQYGLAMANNLNSEVKNDPSTADDIATLDYDTARAWDLGSTDTNSNWNQNYIVPKRFWQELQNTPPENRDAVLKLALKNVQSSDQVQGRLSDNRASNVLGFGSTLNAGVVDANGDGILDQGADIRAALLSANPRPSLKGGPAAVKKYTPADLAQPSVPTGGNDKAIYDKLHDASLKGSVNYDDLAKANLSLDEAIALQDMKGRGNVDQAGVDRVQSELRNKNTDGEIGKVMADGDRGSQINKLTDMLNGDDRRLNKDTVKAKMAELVGQEEADRLAHEASDRKKTRNREAQQDTVKTLVTYGGWAAIPPEGQEVLNSMGTELGEEGMKQLKEVFTWDNNKSPGDNVKDAVAAATKLPGKQGLAAAQILQKHVMDGSIAKGVTGSVKNVGGQAAQVVTGKKKLW